MAYKIYGYDPPYRNKNMMPGMIMLWHGTVGNIPSGWHLCDGAMGTPDLRSKFVRGAHAFLPPGDIGGSITHQHDFVGDGHAHDIPAGPEIAAGADFYSNTTADPATGTTNVGASMPPWYALCYIMKL